MRPNSTAKSILFIALIFVFLFPLASNAFEVLGYLYRSDSVPHLENDTLLRQNKSLENHVRQIQIIAPQAYQIDLRGMLWGTVDPMILKLAQKHDVKVMPLVTNAGFNSIRTHQFLINYRAQQRAISALITVCKKFHYAGIQIDFEHILFTDKNNFTHFYQKISNALHKNGFLISVAIIPRTTDKTPMSNSAKYCLEYWNGAYDYTALGKASDFVTLMAYDQHSNGSTPGSACDPAWAKRIIVYALKYMSPTKISLGVPVHSSYWYTEFGTDSKHVTEADLTYPETQYLVKRFHVHFVWGKKTDVPYAIFTNNDLYNYIFPQNAATFKILFALAKQYHLHGMSLWCLGYEDPKIWKVLSAGQ